MSSPLLAGHFADGPIETLWWCTFRPHLKHFHQEKKNRGTGSGRSQRGGQPSGTIKLFETNRIGRSHGGHQPFVSSTIFFLNQNFFTYSRTTTGHRHKFFLKKNAQISASTLWARFVSLCLFQTFHCPNIDCIYPTKSNKFENIH